MSPVLLACFDACFDIAFEIVRRSGYLGDMKGHLKKYRDRWQARIYLGRQGTRDIWRTRVIDEPQTREGKKAASKAMRAFMASIEESGQLHSPGDDTSVEELVGLWIESKAAEWSLRHLDQMRSHLRTKIAPRIGTLKAAEVTTLDIEEFYRGLMVDGGRGGRPLGAASIRSVNKALRGSFKAARRWGWVDKDPTEFVELPKVRRSPIESPTVEQIRIAQGLIDESSKRSGNSLWSVFFRLAWSTGARRSQILGLQWDDVDLDNQQIVFKRSVVALGSLIEIKGTKTDRPYLVSIDSGTSEALSAWREATGALGGWVFSGANVVGVLSPETVKTWWRRLRVKDPRLKNINFHHFRHFQASYLASQNVPITTISARLGHSDPSVTLGVYSHFFPGADRIAADLMDDI